MKVYMDWVKEIIGIDLSQENRGYLVFGIRISQEILNMVNQVVRPMVIIQCILEENLVVDFMLDFSEINTGCNSSTRRMSHWVLNQQEVLLR
jgi:hypothetical protein